MIEKITVDDIYDLSVDELMNKTPEQLDRALYDAYFRSIKYGEYGGDVSYEMEKLLQAGANPRYSDDKGHNIAHYAAAHGNIIQMSVLFKYDENILNTRSNLNGNTPLHFAANSKKQDMINFIIGKDPATAIATNNDGAFPKGMNGGIPETVNTEERFKQNLEKLEEIIGKTASVQNDKHFHPNEISILFDGLSKAECNLILDVLKDLGIQYSSDTVSILILKRDIIGLAEEDIRKFETAVYDFKYNQANPPIGTIPTSPDQPNYSADILKTLKNLQEVTGIKWEYSMHAGFLAKELNIGQMETLNTIAKFSGISGTGSLENANNSEFFLGLNEENINAFIGYYRDNEDPLIKNVAHYDTHSSPSSAQELGFENNISVGGIKLTTAFTNAIYYNTLKTFSAEIKSSDTEAPIEGRPNTVNTDTYKNCSSPSQACLPC